MSTQIHKLVLPGFWLVFAILGISLAVPAAADAQLPATSAELATSFATPPASARPWVYWFWLNGNITRKGITADLEAMKRVGIGGVLIMEVDQGAPVGPVDFMGARWQDLFTFAVSEAQRLGLEINMNDDAGWDGSGGPWIKPDQSMQKVVFSETQVEGPKTFDGPLLHPQTIAGYYQDISVLAFPSVGAYRIPDITSKACYERGGVGPASTQAIPPDMIIKKASIVDLTAKMDANGHLTWDVPAGQWTIMRFGSTSTGATNHPAPVTGLGLECDKLSTNGIDAQFNGMMAKLIKDVGPNVGKTLVRTHIDSWENGAQNWTQQMPAEFQKRRGYDMMPFLPVFSGRVVDSLEVSERFLWDLRQTISDLVVEDYAGRMEQLAQQHGIALSIEAYGGPCDDMTYGGRADEPMSEFWTPSGGGFECTREMASVAHTYGRPILGAESLTSSDWERWQDYPGNIKAEGDQALCNGVQRFVFHRYAMQPWLNERPGMSMGPWGLHYERTQTWWNDSGPWHEYLSRCQYLLRQGRFVADICYLQPEEAPQGYISHTKRGYDFDNCTAEVVMTRMSVKNGRIVLPDGMSYRVLVLPDSPTMTPGLLQKVMSLVRDGATVIGAPPVRAPGLTGYPACDNEVQRLASELWGNCDGKTVTEHRYGKGRILWGPTPESVLQKMGTPPDFTSSVRLSEIHRSTGAVDLYFIANSSPQAVHAICTFRVTGRQPELWNAETGQMENAPLFTMEKGQTSVMAPLGPAGSVFVVFRKPAGSADPNVSVSRNGATILASARPAPKIVITRAEYGVLTDPARTRSVKASIQALVDEGQTNVIVTQMAADQDPAPQVVKTLNVEYTINGQHSTVSGKDGETIHIGGAAPEISIQKATYGVPGDAVRTRDVTAKVQKIVDGGEDTFQVARLAEGDDPAFGIVKTVVIDYTIQGKHYTATGQDPDEITLSEQSSTEHAVDVRSDQNGRLLLDAYEPGQYEVKTASGKAHRIDIPMVPAPLDVTGPWDVSFEPNLGAPGHISLDKLISWSDSPVDGVKYFSGAATYQKTLSVPADLVTPGHRLYLDLGDVQVMAHVTLNGKDLGILWKPPYRVDITGTVKPGDNQLEIQVVNLWINRMIGDENLPEDSDRNGNGTLKAWPQWVNEDKPSPTGRFTFTTWRLWHKGDPLKPSGLIGPVTVQTVAEAPIR